MNGLPKIIAIVGPTASGKSALAIEVAQKFNCEIVSADSRQVYRGMDIGTAKPPRDHEPRTMNNELYLSSGIPHHLIDVKNPNEEYTLAEYQNDAVTTIKEILGRNKLPILVGGTGLYIQAVLENLSIPKTKADPELRKKIELEIAENGLDAVFQKLVELDPEAEYIVDAKNPRRVVRALEVAITTGEPFTAQRRKNEELFNALKIGLNPPQEVLRERINSRVDKMICDGLLQEVMHLVSHYGEDCQAFDAIGYREIIERIKGKISLKEAIVAIQTNTWRYAKRQMTWFKKDKEIQWVKDEVEAKIREFLKEPEVDI